MEFYDVFILKTEDLELRHSHVRMEFRSLARAGNADMAGAGLRPGDIDKACAVDLAGIEFIEGRLTDQAGCGNADAAIPHQNDIAILELYAGQIPAGQKFVQINVGNNLFAAFDGNMAEAAALRDNTARTIQIV